MTRIYMYIMSCACHVCRFCLSKKNWWRLTSEYRTTEKNRAVPRGNRSENCGNFGVSKGGIIEVPIALQWTRLDQTTTQSMSVQILPNLTYTRLYSSRGMFLAKDPTQTEYSNERGRAVPVNTTNPMVRCSPRRTSSSHPVETRK